MRSLESLVLMLMTASGLLSAQTGRGHLDWTGTDSTTAVGKGRVVFRAIAWRDFMPRVGSAGGSDLMVNLQIQSQDTMPLPSGLRVDSAWVRSAKSLWATAPIDEPRPDLPHGLDLMLRGGPRWTPGRLIDVMVRLRLPSGEIRHLQSRGQPIGRTD